MSVRRLFVLLLPLVLASLPARAASEEARELYSRLCVQHGAEAAITAGAMTLGPDIPKICRNEAERAFPDQAPALPVAQCAPLPLAGLQAMCQQMLPDAARAAAFCPGFAAARAGESALLSGEQIPDCPGSFYMVLTESCVRLADERSGSPQQDGVCLFTARGEQPIIAPLQTKAAINDIADDLMRRRFPIGTPVAALVETLTASGFTCDPATALEGACNGSQTALAFARRRFSSMANLNWGLRWKAGADGRVERLRVTLFPVHL
ncbi:MAG TPA: hypothetical protein VK558_02065 [Patescibacteria group bacterium]|nr:hypothetical protein [Patescibacteria group bacterium]